MICLIPTFVEYLRVMHAHLKRRHNVVIQFYSSAFFRGKWEANKKFSLDLRQLLIPKLVFIVLGALPCIYFKCSVWLRKEKVEGKNCTLCDECACVREDKSIFDSVLTPQSFILPPLPLLRKIVAVGKSGEKKGKKRLRNKKDELQFAPTSHKVKLKSHTWK